MDNFIRKPMATVTASLDTVVTNYLKSQLSAIPSVVSLHFIADENGLSVWVGTSQYGDHSVRNSIYDIEDRAHEKFRGAGLDFHLLAIPEGRKVSEFISNAKTVFDRTA